jgi:hypothetical protein
VTLITDRTERSERPGQPGQPVTPGAQLLFQEARQRRRRRRLIGGIVAVILAVVLGLTLVLFAFSGRTVPAGPAPAAPSTGGLVVSASAFSIRPVLCYAPPYAGGGAPGSGAASLPGCAPAFDLSAANLDVEPGSGASTLHAVGPDPQFARIPSTPAAADTLNSTVLLPGDSSAGSPRYVLGPASLTAADIRSARAQRVDGGWTVDIGFNGRGAAVWDALGGAQFHAIIGFVWNGHVVSAPVVDPTQRFFRSFNGQGQISGGLTEHEAKSIAAGI